MDVAVGVAGDRKCSRSADNPLQQPDPHLVQTVLQQHITDLLTEAADRFDPPGIGGRSDG